VYIQLYIVALSRSHYCNSKATIHFLFIVVGLDVAINNIKVFSVAMQTHEWVPFAMLSSTKYFVTYLITSIKYYESVSVLVCDIRHFIFSASCCIIFSSLFCCALLSMGPGVA
jgi:Ni,Fe-hydrogenase I cytochrome b subunit